MRARFVGALLLSMLGGGCKPSPMAKIEALRDALADEDGARLSAATHPLSGCMPPGSPGCLDEAARYFGSKSGFHATPPDQASAAAIATLLARDAHGERYAPADAWLGSMRTGEGPGPDALRLSVARKMADAAKRIGHACTVESDALALMREVSAAMPGACVTYARLGAGIDDATLAPELSADHSPCVQKDLGRADGPGGTYGNGTWRATEGALALWKDVARALHAGAMKMTGKPRAALDARLDAIDAATANVTLRKLAEVTDETARMAAAHADAGVGAPRVERDAGATKPAAGGAPKR